MTRLTENDIQNIPETLPAYDKLLISKTGHSLRQMACRAAGIEESRFQAALKDRRVGVVPMTAGEGALKGFCATVSGIVRYLGAEVFMAEKTDAAGIAESVEARAHILLFADDHRFIALDLEARKIVDNAVATGSGFATGLTLMADSSPGIQTVLVLGCGPVGQSAVQTLISTGYRVAIYDIDSRAYIPMLEAYGKGVEVVNDLETALHDHQLVLDATPSGAFILGKHVHRHAIVSAPGMPLGLDNAAQKVIADRLLHDPLQIGVATMLASILSIR